MLITILNYLNIFILHCLILKCHSVLFFTTLWFVLKKNCLFNFYILVGFLYKIIEKYIN